MNECRVVRRLLAKRPAEWSASERQRVTDHLANCADCTARVHDYAEQDRRLSGMPRVSLTGPQRQKLFARLESKRRGYQMRGRVSTVLGVLAGLIAVAAIAVGIALVIPQREAQQPAVGAPSALPTETGIETITFACPDFQESEFSQLATDFEAAHPEVHVQIIATDKRDFAELAATADTFINSAWFVPSDMSYLLDLGPFVNAPSFPADDFFPGTLDHFRWQGGIYGLPAHYFFLLMFYNREMFDQAGLPYPRIGWTWDDFAAAAVKLTVRDGDKVSRYGFVDSYPEYTFLAMLQSQGVSLWNEQSAPPQPLFTSPEVAAVLQDYVDLARRYEAMPMGIDSTQSHSLIVGRQAAMWTDVATYREYYAEQFRAGTLPYPEGVAAASPRGLFGFFVSAGTIHPQAAWRWLSYLSANYRPALSDELPGRRSVAERLTWWQQLDEETRSVYEYALAHPVTNDDSWNMRVSRAMKKVWEEGTGVEEALAAAQEWALEVQAEYAAAVSPEPLPVASPLPTPEPQEGRATITFCYAPWLLADRNIYKGLAAQFTQDHPDIQVQVVAPDASDPLELAKECDSFVATANYAEYPEYRQSFRALQPLLQADPSFDLADYYPQFLQPLQQEGELWGLPAVADALVVYLNLDRFAKGGVPLPEPGWSIEDFISTAGTLSDQEHFGFTTTGCAYGDLVFVLQLLGAHLYDDSRDVNLYPPLPTLDDPTVITALGQYANLSQGRALFPATPSEQCGWPAATIGGDYPVGVESGKIAMWADRTMSQLTGPGLAFDVGAVPLPLEAGGRASTMIWTHAYYISAQTTAPQACWEWLTFLSAQPETAAMMLPTRRSIAASPVWQGQTKEAFRPAYLTTLESYDGAFRLDPRQWYSLVGYTYPWLYQAYEEVVAGQEAQVALTAAQAKADAFLSCLEAAANYQQYFGDHHLLLSCAQQVDPNYPVVSSEP